MSSTPIQITFFGTASAVPSPSRNHSCLSVTTSQSTYLFDCGEASQHRIMNSTPPIITPTILTTLISIQPYQRSKLAKLSCIFVTHLHGDHSFGLPGLLCTASNAISASTDPETFVLQIFGPKGLRAYIRNSLKGSHSRLACRYKVTELVTELDPNSSCLNETDYHPEEVKGVDLLPSETTKDTSVNWDVFRDEEFTFKAGQIQHTVPTVGYVLTEHPVKGKLKVDMIVPHLQRNREALGIKNPLVLLSKVKNGEILKLPDGTVLDPKEFLESDRIGRKFTILGDTCNSDNIINLAIDSDVLIHEATNAFLKSDLDAGQTLESVTQKTVDHGHSTPNMAGAFAKKIGAKFLILNHFSPRYKGDLDAESISVMDEIRDAAISEFNSPNVLCAMDLMLVNVAK